VSTAIDRKKLADYILHESVGLGPLEELLRDDAITEVMVNGARDIFAERGGKLQRLPVTFSSDKSLYGVIERIVAPIGRRVDESSPLVDARLQDGSRVNIIIPPLALKGPTITIRKFSKKRLQISDLLKYQSVSEPMVEFLQICVEHKKNVIVSGGTGSGKTTLLNVLSNLIPPEERIVTIEDAAELRLHHDNLVTLEARPKNTEGKGEVAIRELVKNSLRMRPDRIVVGECRGGEALDMLQAMNTGHDGSLTTAHANTPRDLLSRLEVMVLMAGMDLPVAAIREQIASAVNIIVQQTRFACGTRKVTRIVDSSAPDSAQTARLKATLRAAATCQPSTKSYAR
jgi:pilus assembly protein CpaF